MLHSGLSLQDLVQRQVTGLLRIIGIVVAVNEIHHVAKVLPVGCELLDFISVCSNCRAHIAVGYDISYGALFPQAAENVSTGSYERLRTGIAKRYIEEELLVIVLIAMQVG